MRLELHLFLWVTAGLAVVWQLSGGAWLPHEVISDQVQIRAQLVAATEGRPETENRSSSARAAMVPYDTAIRPLFPAMTESIEVKPVERLPELQPPPVLKGVLNGPNGRRAVFSRDAATAEVMTASAGEIVDGFRVTRVGADFVMAVSPAGEEVRFELRGAGEGG